MRPTAAEIDSGDRVGRHTTTVAREITRAERGASLGWRSRLNHQRRVQMHGDLLRLAAKLEAEKPGNAGNRCQQQRNVPGRLPEPLLRFQDKISLHQCVFQFLAFVVGHSMNSASDLRGDIPEL